MTQDTGTDKTFIPTSRFTSRDKNSIYHVSEAMLERDISIAFISVRPSVHLSVTLLYAVKTFKHVVGRNYFAAR